MDIISPKRSLFLGHPRTSEREPLYKYKFLTESVNTPDFSDFKYSVIPSTFKVVLNYDVRIQVSVRPLFYGKNNLLESQKREFRTTPDLQTRGGLNM